MSAGKRFEKIAKADACGVMQTGLRYALLTKGREFNWRDYMRLGPSRALDNHGRGIARAAAFSFNDIVYDEKGNSVIATTVLNDVLRTSRRLSACAIRIALMNDFNILPRAAESQWVP